MKMSSKETEEESDEKKKKVLSWGNTYVYLD